MIKFDKPANLNGIELMAELNAAGIEINNFPSIDLDNNLFLDIANKDKAKAQTVVAAHNGTMTAPDNSTAKSALLAKLGITEDELRLLLS